MEIIKFASLNLSHNDYMSGFFGCVSRKECVADVFYGTDYHSHLGTKKAGMAFFNGEDFVRSIHSIESAYSEGFFPMFICRERIAHYLAEFPKVRLSLRR